MKSKGTIIRWTGLMMTEMDIPILLPFLLKKKRFNNQSDREERLTFPTASISNRSHYLSNFT